MQAGSLPVLSVHALMLAAILVAPSVAMQANERMSTGPSLPVVGAGQDSGGVLHLDPHASCLSSVDRSRIDKALNAYYAENPAARGNGAGCEEYHAKYEFYPMGGTIWGDLFINNFNDLDPDSGEILDFDCRQWTYDGHNATDVDLRSFGEQAIGVPVLAAMDGIVVDSHDGEDDMNTAPLGQPANYVVLDHGHGRIAGYFHFKKGSVAVRPGETVVAGQQIGLTGSSGNSTWPHLHFSTMDRDEAFEPFAGPCRPGESGFYDQEPVDLAFRVSDAGLSRTNIATVPKPPFTLPRTGQFAFGDGIRQIWFFVRNFPASPVMDMRVRRPNGSIAASWHADWTNSAFRSGWYYLNLPYHPDLDSVTGTWTAEVDVNGANAVSLPFEVTASFDPDLNRPPEQVGATFDPSQPKVDQVLFCRVDTDLVLDDLDYEIVSYQYEWSVNGGVVRTVQSAGHADAIPAAWTEAGDVVTCTVTPMDATSAGMPVTIQTEVDAATFDCNGNFVEDAIDIASGSSVDTNADGVPDECQAPVLFVDRGATGARLGTSWADAYTDLQTAMRVASSRPQDDPAVIWVAEGVYRPDRGCLDREASFTLPQSVRLLGGFSGTESLEEQRDPSTNVTILSGDLLEDDFPGLVNRTDNSRHVLWCGESTGECVVDGFVIEGGHADGATFAGSRGAGAWIRRGSPTFINCRFEDNWAAQYGGAVHADVGASPLFEDCEFTGNAAPSGGGGVQLFNCTASFEGSVFTGNHTDGTGGGIRTHNADTTVAECEFDGNTASTNGGAIRHLGTGTLGLSSCVLEANMAEGGAGAIATSGALEVSASTFSSNSAPGWDAGAVWVLGGSATLTSCDFVGNTCKFSGGALQANGHVELLDCRFLENQAGNSGGAIRFIDTDGSHTIERCLFEDNSCGGSGGAVFAKNEPDLTPGGTAPFTVRSVRFVDNAATFGGGLALSTSGADVDNCLFLDNQAVAGGAIYASASDAAITNCTTDANGASVGIGLWTDGGMVLMRSCILRDVSGSLLHVQGGGLDVSYSNVRGGHPGVANIDQDPLFVNPSSGDYRLRQGSPSIDAGSNAATTPDVTKDLAGRPRIVDHPFAADCPQAAGSCGSGPIVDMGAYERVRYEPAEIGPGMALPKRYD